MRNGRFAEKLDYFTSPGYLDGGDSRDKSGIFPPGTGPTMVLSTKGVFRFDETTKEIYLAHVHPGVSVDDIRKDVPWDLKVASDLTETAPPTEEEVNFVRRFAPRETVSRQLMMELAIGNFMKKAAARKA